MNEFLEQFLVESRELVEQATTDLLALEHDPDNRPVLDSAFRAFHTLKGAAGIMDFAAMSRLTHAAEDLLASVRSGEQVLTAVEVTHCLSGLDQITVWLDFIEAEGVLPENTEDTAPPADEPAPGSITADPQIRSAAPASSANASTLPDYAIEILKEQLALISLPQDVGYLGRIGAAGRVCRNVLGHFGLVEAADDIATSLALLQAILPVAPGPDIAPGPVTAISAATPASGSLAAPADAQSATRSLRVDVGRIEELVKITGELIVATNALGHSIQSRGDPDRSANDLQKLHARFDRLTAELLRSVLATRVLPIQRVFQRFPRLVREISARLNKPVRLVTEGELTEADKVVVEALFEPILHVLRNAIDHGVETGAERKAAGKAETSVITLRARRDGDQVVIEVEDDGGGINLAAIRDTAIKRKLITKAAADQMPDAEILDLIFLPGFSTAAALSDISGRGVGMDAVRAGIEKLGGRVVLQSVKAIGTTVSFILPFTVMMTRVLIVHAGGQIFGIPFDEVVETVQLPAGRVAPIGSAQAVVLHGKTIPLINLAQLLGLARVPGPGVVDMTATEPASGVVNAAVVKAGDGELAALQVDRFDGQLEVILKPMDGLLAGMSGIAGSTLLGDGKVLIVLELRQLLR